MSLLTSNQFISCDILCSRLIQDSAILYSGFVNNKGRIVTSSKNNSLKFHDEKSLEIFVMEIALEFSMKNGFNDILGKIQYTVTKRDKFNVLCIPMDDLILVMIVNDSVSIEKIVRKVYHTLYEFTKINTSIDELV